MCQKDLALNDRQKGDMLKTGKQTKPTCHPERRE